MAWWRRPQNSNSVDVVKARATRALYLSEDIQKVEVKLEIETGEKVTLVFPSRVAFDLITQMIAAHKAIHPEIVVPRSSSPSW